MISVFGGLVWGIAQEFIYRGWLQTEFTRRFGAIAGLVAAVFGIGLFFGIVYSRSGNVCIPAVMHGLWPPNMT